MFSRLIGFILLLIGVYILMIFIKPDIADQYGDKEINAKIRALKDSSLKLGSWAMLSGSLFENVTSTSKNIIEEWTRTVKQIQTTVEQKTQEVKDTANSVQEAVDAVNAAKSKVENLTNFSWAIK
jgi:methyl-accepting chemotaxis protein